MDRGGIGPVEADHAPRGIHDVVGSMAWRQAVTTGQPGSTLIDLDLPHGQIVPRSQRPVVRKVMSVSSTTVSDSTRSDPAWAMAA
jgi:hypothetical protein